MFSLANAVIILTAGTIGMHFTSFLAFTNRQTQRPVRQAVPVNEAQSCAQLSLTVKVSASRRSNGANSFENKDLPDSRHWPSPPIMKTVSIARRVIVALTDARIMAPRDSTPVVPSRRCHHEYKVVIGHTEGDAAR
ncbi:MAG: hypothetical protein CMJ78_01545 [Planctomycetaceae bacterium]|nr:hypothetical protein [Planctomycetaceae bacterium]